MEIEEYKGTSLYTSVESWIKYINDELNRIISYVNPDYIKSSSNQVITTIAKVPTEICDLISKAGYRIEFYTDNASFKNTGGYKVYIKEEIIQEYMEENNMPEIKKFNDTLSNTSTTSIDTDLYRTIISARMFLKKYDEERIAKVDRQLKSVNEYIESSIKNVEPDSKEYPEIVYDIMDEDHRLYDVTLDILSKYGYDVEEKITNGQYGEPWYSYHITIPKKTINEYLEEKENKSK